MAQTGMESLEIIHGIIDETNPDLVIVIDAMAARSTKVKPDDSGHGYRDQSGQRGWKP